MIADMRGKVRVFIFIAALFGSAFAFSSPLIGVLCATPDESTPILKNMGHVKIVEHGNVKYFMGAIGDTAVILVVGGYGSINASKSTSFL